MAGVLLRSIRSGAVVESSLLPNRHAAQPRGVVLRCSPDSRHRSDRGELPRTKPLPAGSFQEPAKVVVCDLSTAALVDVAALAERPARRYWAVTRSGA
jgi:hypothetical protein